MVALGFLDMQFRDFVFGDDLLSDRSSGLGRVKMFRWRTAGGTKAPSDASPFSEERASVNMRRHQKRAEIPSIVPNRSAARVPPILTPISNCQSSATANVSPVLTAATSPSAPLRLNSHTTSV